jgi:hypothetical protein
MQTKHSLTPRDRETMPGDSYADSSALGVAAIWLVFYLVICAAAIAVQSPVGSVAAIP